MLISNSPRSQEQHLLEIHSLEKYHAYVSIKKSHHFLLKIERQTRKDMSNRCKQELFIRNEETNILWENSILAYKDETWNRYEALIQNYLRQN